MKYYMKRLAATCILLFLVSNAGITAPDIPITIKTSIDWNTQKIIVQARLNMQRAGFKIPAGRTDAELYMKTQLPLLCRDTVLSVAFDSYRTILDTLNDQTIRAADIEAYMSSWTQVASSLSTDLTYLNMEITYDLIKLASLYIKHTKALDLPVTLDYEPTRNYSGILIYAKGYYPVQGEFETGKLEPSLFPRIYDESMQLILERNYVNPEILRNSGICGWAQDINSPDIVLRTGQDPLRILAYKVFGTKRSDIIITKQDALKILLNENNRKLIENGKVVIVYGK
ncbi:MAG TPA: hypothetical protein PK074_01635 [Spirochaetales bacterium]|nr:hypothetical protein [Spirochaetales bacterium]HQG39798.1 hypothetical protein [Spirochaetales bacterium]HQK33402.1 hypothetical protein [Spirochaetales bacterium]HRV28867.1 hypothetical protein [Spirochaetia bacterium]